MFELGQELLQIAQMLQNRINTEGLTKAAVLEIRNSLVSNV